MGERRKDAVRDAATVILVRREGGAGPRVLMGQRGKAAAFMPEKFVFPGGAVDEGDAAVPLADPPTEAQARVAAGARSPGAFLAAAVRELAEETGLALSRPGDGALPDPWRRLLPPGHLPATRSLVPIFRAITPPGRPRRFDARFYMAPADGIATDIEDFSRAEAELSHLRWLTLDEAIRLDLPFITEVVLAEVGARLAEPLADRPVPFFHHAERHSVVTAL